MARPTKQGLDYFPFDVDFFSDEKVQFVSARFGVKGEIITIKLLCRIYRNGYYTEWNDDTALLFAKLAGEGFTPGLVSEIVSELVMRGFFDKSLRDRFSVLTSRGIQKRYMRACQDSKRIGWNIDERYDLISTGGNSVNSGGNEQKIINSGGNSVNSGGNSINSGGKYTKESKVKERKVKENINIPPQSVGGSKSDFIDELMEIFSTEYYGNRESEFINISPAKERAALGKLMGMYRKKNPKSDTDKARDDFRKFFRQCLMIPETWHRDRMSPSHMVNQFQQIVKIIERMKNGNGTGTYTARTGGASYADIIGSVTKNFANS